MPWCGECSRFLTPTSMGQGGECPSCGRVLATAEGSDAGPLAGAGAVETGGEALDEPHVPWHFKLLVLATIVYLAWRVIQGVVWVAARL